MFWFKNKRIYLIPWVILILQIFLLYLIILEWIWPISNYVFLLKEILDLWTVQVLNLTEFFIHYDVAVRIQVWMCRKIVTDWFLICKCLDWLYHNELIRGFKFLKIFLLSFVIDVTLPEIYIIELYTIRSIFKNNGVYRRLKKHTYMLDIQIGSLDFNIVFCRQRFLLEV